MNGALIGNLSVSELISLAAHWLTLWLGLSLLSRRPRSTATMLVAAAFLVVSAYLLSVVFLLTPSLAAPTSSGTGGSVAGSSSHRCSSFTPSSF